MADQTAAQKAAPAKDVPAEAGPGPGDVRDESDVDSSQNKPVYLQSTAAADLERRLGPDGEQVVGAETHKSRLGVTPGLGKDENGNVGIDPIYSVRSNKTEQDYPAGKGVTKDAETAHENNVLKRQQGPSDDVKDAAAALSTDVK